MKSIPLSVTGKKNSGKFFAIVDDEDYEWLSKYNWSVYIKKNGAKYAITSYNGTTILLHRMIMGVTDPKIQIDHINNDGLQCWRKNMRIATCAENNRNRRAKKNSTSKYLGVSWHSRDKKWISRIYMLGKIFQLGRFNSEEAAAIAYDKKARELFGEFANLNFK